MVANQLGGGGRKFSSEAGGHKFAEVSEVIPGLYYRVTMLVEYVGLVTAVG